MKARCRLSRGRSIGQVWPAYAKGVAAGGPPAGHQVHAAGAAPGPPADHGLKAHSWAGPGGQSC
eukprot:1486804-Karenia_brevis.AAC.1